MFAERLFLLWQDFISSSVHKILILQEIKNITYMYVKIYKIELHKMMSHFELLTPLRNLSN